MDGSNESRTENGLNESCLDLSLNVMNFGMVQDSLKKAFSSGEPFSVYHTFELLMRRRTTMPMSRENIHCSLNRTSQSVTNSLQSRVRLQRITQNEIHQRLEVLEHHHVDVQKTLFAFYFCTYSSMGQV